MRPGLTPRARGAPDTPLMERLQHLPANTIRSCVRRLGKGHLEGSGGGGGGGGCCSRVS